MCSVRLPTRHRNLARVVLTDAGLAEKLFCSKRTESDGFELPHLTGAYPHRLHRTG